jgi:carboxymethylenebutenolidase
MRNFLFGVVSNGYMIQMRMVVLLLAVAFTGTSCGPQPPKSSQQSSRETSPRPTPIFYPQGEGPFPAILLLPPAAHDISAENSIARKLADEGYVARALDYGNRKFGGIFNDASQMDSFKKLVSESLALLKGQAGIDPNRIGVIGYSLGGFFVTYLASRSEDVGIRAGVIYYGVYNVPEEVRKLRIPILAFQGDADHMQEFIRNALMMRQVAQDHQKQFDLVFYTRARHGFDRIATGPYDKANARNAWIRMIQFMDAHVKRAH